MRYTLHIHPKVTEYLRKIPIEVYRQIIPDIRKLESDQEPKDVQELEGRANTFYYLIEVHKVTFEIDEDNQIVRVLDVKLDL